jgi:hypothetical protein
VGCLVGRAGMHQLPGERSVAPDIGIKQRRRGGRSDATAPRIPVPAGNVAAAIGGDAPIMQLAADFNDRVGVVGFGYILPPTCETWAVRSGATF